MSLHYFLKYFFSSFLNADRGSIKSLVYESQKKHPNIKALYALVTQCVQNSDQIKASFEKIGLFEKEPRFDRNLAEILTTELVFGRKLLPGKSRPEETLRKYESELLKCISGPVQEKPGSTLPRYVRVNALKATLELVTQQLVSEGFVEVVYDRKRTSYDEFLDLIDNLANRQFLLDYHIDNLLVFPPKTHFYDNPLYKDGMILLQDKASCLTVQALEVPCGSVVLDACAAPGMKTSQIAATVFRNRSTGELVNTLFC